ncbi:MAG: hypothetical protein AAF581_15235 [Planctomycetota bacterium]
MGHTRGVGLSALRVAWVVVLAAAVLVLFNSRALVMVLRYNSEELIHVDPRQAQYAVQYGPRFSWWDGHLAVGVRWTRPTRGGGVL